MPIFKFKAKTLDGKETEGTKEAKDRFALAKELKQKGYILFDFEKETKRRKIDLLSSFSFGKIPFSEKMLFTRNLGVMIDAGLPISRALNVLTEQTKSKKFKNVLSKIDSSIKQGKNLSDSMAEHKKVFSKLYVAMMRAGEKTGKAHEALKIVADQMEEDLTLKRKIKGAMIYPTIVTTAMIGIAALMLIYVVPNLVSTFKELDVDLPLSTQFIIWFSSSLINNSILVFGILLSLIIFIFLALHTKPVKKLISTLFLYAPLLSPLVQKTNSARTARTLSSLISSGVGIVEALEITSDVVQNYHYKKVLKKAKDAIQKGSSLAVSFKKTKRVFPPIVGEMIAVGEETGKLPEMLLKLAVFYEEEVSQATKDIATIIEPVLMLIIGAAVGFFAISMIKPMYSMMSGL